MKKQLLTIATATGLLFTAFQGNASAHEKNYKVKSGDSLSKISKTYNLTVAKIKEYNGLTTDLIKVGQNLSLLPIHTHYTVRSGDSLSKIAKAKNTTVAKLKEINNLKSNAIKIGQSLVIPSTKTSSSTGNITSSPSSNTTHTHYTVQSGDSLSKIAKAKNTTVAKLKELNGLKSDLIKIGQSLVITSTKTSSSTGSTSSSTNSTSSSTAKASAVVAEAKKYIGVPYVWGGSTPSGFDCSGYVNYVFNKVGISIPRTVATIWNATKTVSSPKVGDFVFYETGTGPSHLGIYIGSNKFIHAGSSTGVTITDMSNSYWSSRYLGAKTAF